MAIRILLIDDDQVDRLAVRRALRQAGLDVDLQEAANAATGVQLFEQEQFDCVLLDYRLPDIDGLEILPTLRDMNRDKRVPIVMLTGQGSEAIAVDAMKHGVHDYLVKDETKPEALHRAILNAMEVARLQREYQQAQQELRQQREWFEVTLASIGDAVIATDTHGIITFINQVAEALTGWFAHEALTHPIADVFRVIHAQTHQAVDNPVARVLQKGQKVEFTDHTVLITRDDCEVAIATSAAPIRNSGGTLHGVVLVFRDISTHRRMEEELLRVRKIESVGVLAGGIAHDFNNLLTGILGNISLARMLAGSDERIVKRLLQAEKACQRATGLTQQLLTFSRGGGPIRQTVSIAELLRESTGLALRGLNVRATLTIADDLWPVDADVGQLNQVMHNVVLNAAQAMPHGGTVQVQAENMVLHPGSSLPLQEGRYLKISVTDHGNGIPAEILSNIFDPYFTTKEHGSGLGLATAYAIVTKHNGHMTVASQVGVGTTFTIYLLASEHPALVPQDLPATPTRSAGRILVMDDEEAICDLLSDMLTALGYESVCTRHGAEAIAAYQHAQAAGQPFMAAILDITVPGGMGGKETMASLRALDPQVKAVISSGYAQDPIMADFIQYGFSAVVAKPYTVGGLQHALQGVLQGRQS
jgi:two-component system cell cycle sensor histidine kinase/response regulator CckA